MQKEIAQQFLKDFGIKHEEKLLNTNINEWFKAVSSNQLADIRFGIVDIGGEIESWGVRMMFCSQLGVSFPDLGGKICQLTDKVEEEDIDYTVYKTEFETLIKQDSVVVPLYLQGQLWLFSKDFDVSNLSPTMGVIPFDKVGIVD